MLEVFVGGMEEPKRLTQILDVCLSESESEKFYSNISTIDDELQPEPTVSVLLEMYSLESDEGWYTANIEI